MPTSSRILFRLSRLMAAVPAANPVRCGCPGWAAAGSGWRGPGAPAGCTRHGVPQPAEARALRERAPRKGPPSQTWQRDVFHIPPPTERPRGAQARARSWTSQGGVCAEGPPATKKDRARAARRPLAPLRRPHAPPACHARPKRPADGGQAHTALCAAPGGAPGDHGGGARRAARGRARSAPVGAAASGGASRAAAGGCSTPCAPPSAATNAAQAGPVPEPLDALEPRAKGGEGRPCTPARPPSAPGPRVRLAPPRKAQSPRFVEGGGDS